METHSKLIELLSYVSEESPFYKRLFKAKGFDVSNIENHFSEIPFTTKDDLAKHNDDFLCVPKSKIVDFVTTSGTLSKPVSFYLTEKDTDRLADNEAQSLALAGGTNKDVFQLMVTMDQRFMAGLAYYLGIQKLGGGAVRVGPGALFNQLESIVNFESTVLIAIPSFIIKLISFAKENGVDLNSTKVKSIVCIGEPIRSADFSVNELGKQILAQWDVKLHSTYASTEMGAAFTECSEGKGGHLNSDLLFLEVVNGEGVQVGEGELGEVVVTTLGVEAMPLVRYKTGDLCHVYNEKCACGNESTRLGPVISRKQQMIKYKGTTLFPSAIFNVLAVLGIELYQVRVAKNEFGNDQIIIALSEKDEKSERKLKARFKSVLRVTPKVEFAPADILTKAVFVEGIRKPQKIVFVTEKDKEVTYS